MEKLSSESLQTIRDKAGEILKARGATALRRGAIGWFLDRAGTKRFMQVRRINAKTISGIEVDPVTFAPIAGRSTWRVSPNLLNMVLTDKGGTSKAATAPTPYVPSTTFESSW